MDAIAEDVRHFSPSIDIGRSRASPFQDGGLTWLLKAVAVA